MLSDWKDFLGNTATISTIGLFLVGIEICAGFYKNKTTGNISPMSFLTGVLMTFVWYKYGTMRGDPNITLVNGTGLVLQSIYVICFFKYSSTPAHTAKQIVIVLLALVGVQLYIMYSTDVVENIGLLGATMSVAYCGAPLSSISHVIKTRSSSVLPFYLILVTALVMGQWSLYGTIIEDNYVLIPNFIGFLLAVMQLGLFAYFPSDSHLTQKTPDEEAASHLSSSSSSSSHQPLMAEAEYVLL